MVLIPSSTITLYSDVDIDNGEQLAFSSKAAQKAYFQHKITLLNTPCTYVKKTGALRLEVSPSTVRLCNYISFDNPNFDYPSVGDTVYARIVEYNYVNNDCTEIYYAIDYWQTFMFEANYESCFIEREHLSQADFNKGETNPFDPTIFEFKTPEDLLGGPDMEKVNYTISSAVGSDGFKIALKSHTLTGATSRLGVLAKVAYLNLEGADQNYIDQHSGSFDPTKLPSYKFMLVLHDIALQGWGFFKISKELCDYFGNRYGSTWTYTDPMTLGSEWMSHNLEPFQETRYVPPVMYIYDMYGASEDVNHGQFALIPYLLDALLAYETEQGLDNAIIDLSIIPNDIMTLAGSIADSGTPFSVEFNPTQTGLVRNKKLFRSPYCYGRLIAPNGDVKEYSYEKFKALQDAMGNAKLRITLDITNKPTLIIAPVGYKYSGVSQGVENTNISEALMFAQFPTLPYNIDAFLAQVAAVANDTIANRTIENAADRAVTRNEISGDVETYTNLSKTAQLASNAVGIVSGNPAAIVSAVGGIAGSGVDIMKYNAELEMQREKFYAQSEKWRKADAALNELGSSAIARQLNQTRGAYIANHYHRSNGDGSSNFSTFSYCDIIILNVSLSPDISALYDDYFDHYGYKSGRCGIPRVINFISGANTDATLPHWTTIDGKLTTYIKTMDMKVSHSMLEVASYIKNMFDNGVRMIKGDLPS